MGFVVWLAVREPMLHTAFGFEGVNYGFAYILTGIGLGILNPLTGMIMNAVSRRAEYRADRQAVQEGYGEAMITAFKKLAKDNFAHLAPSKINVVLEYSHPPLSSRVEEVEKAMKKQ
jgi:STE24 endopeptidase